jgi:hypothetical protein
VFDMVSSRWISMNGSQSSYRKTLWDHAQYLRLAIELELITGKKSCGDCKLVRRHSGSIIDFTCTWTSEMYSLRHLLIRETAKC